MPRHVLLIPTVAQIASLAVMRSLPPSYGLYVQLAVLLLFAAVWGPWVVGRWRRYLDIRQAQRQQADVFRRFVAAHSATSDRTCERN